MNPQPQLDLFTEKVKPLPPSQQEVMESLRMLIVASTTADIQRCLAEHNITRERSCLAKRLGELREKGLVEPVGHDFSRKGHPTTWRRTGRTLA